MVKKLIQVVTVILAIVFVYNVVLTPTQFKSKATVDFSSTKTVEIVGPINTMVAESVIAQLRKLDRQNDGKPILLRINSPGGGVYSGFAIIDAMKHTNTTINVVCEGTCASMGAMILLSGEKGHRYSMPHAMILLHSVGTSIEGTLPEIEVELEELYRLQNMVVKQIRENTTMSDETIAKILKKDSIFGAEDAKKLGVIDHVL